VGWRARKDKPRTLSSKHCRIGMITFYAARTVSTPTALAALMNLRSNVTIASQ
jgi:hypothetical protein